ncbi:hypothetical protein G0U57_014259, partial [Chelydra serpentina]
MARYNRINYSKLNSFIDHLPAEHREQFQAIVAECQLLPRTILRVSLNAADTSVHLIATAGMMRRVSWLQLSSFPKEVHPK